LIAIPNFVALVRKKGTAKSAKYTVIGVIGVICLKQNLSPPITVIDIFSAAMNV